MASQSAKEESLIPYQATDLTGARLLILAAHPDDETLGAGGTIVLNAGRAEAIQVWIATDGARQEGVDPAQGPAYGARRRAEAEAAAESLGLSSPHFGSLPDRELAAHSRELDAALGSLIEEFHPDLILCPSPVEIHPDHRAVAEALYQRVAASRPTDPDHDRFRFLRLAFYELSHPLLPNVLVDISSVAARKEKAVRAYASQQAVRDYAGALQGLNAYRRLTLPGGGPVEAFRVLGYPEISTQSLEEFRRSIGPAIIRDGERGPAPVAVLVRTRNRPALLKEALESLRAQTARPTQVVLVNDGGASVADVVSSFREAFEISLREQPERCGRSAAANRAAEAARADLMAFLDDDDRCYPDHLERLIRAYRAGPEPVVYSDAVTVIFARGENGWQPQHRTLQYSLDYDPDYLLLANYIPLHTLLLPRTLFQKVRGFDEALDYSEDWDFLIRLSFETAFRHVRAVTCEYRVFQDPDRDFTHASAGAMPFQEARRRIYERYAAHRTEAGLARVMDRLRSQIAFWSERDGISQGELRYQRESHRALNTRLAKTEQEKARAEQGQSEREMELAHARRQVSDLETERARLLAENELVHARLAELFASNEDYNKKLSSTYTEIDRLNSILAQIYVSRTWKLHLFLDRLRGR